MTLEDRSVRLSEILTRATARVSGQSTWAICLRSEPFSKPLDRGPPGAPLPPGPFILHQGLGCLRGPVTSSTSLRWQSDGASLILFVAFRFRPSFSKHQPQTTVSTPEASILVDETRRLQAPLVPVHLVNLAWEMQGPRANGCNSLTSFTATTYLGTCCSADQSASASKLYRGSSSHFRLCDIVHRLVLGDQQRVSTLFMALRARMDTDDSPLTAAGVDALT